MEIRNRPNIAIQPQRNLGFGTLGIRACTRNNVEVEDWQADNAACTRAEDLINNALNCSGFKEPKKGLISENLTKRFFRMISHPNPEAETRLKEEIETTGRAEVDIVETGNTTEEDRLYREGEAWFDDKKRKLSQEPQQKPPQETITEYLKSLDSTPDTDID